MLKLQEIFLLVRFYNRISCHKGFKVKISFFFMFFFCLTPLKPECSRSRKTRAEEIQKSASTGLHEWSENVVSVEHRQFFISYLSEMKTVSMLTLHYSSAFYSLFLPFFVLEIFKFKYDKFFVRNSASISKFE